MGWSRTLTTKRPRRSASSIYLIAAVCAALLGTDVQFAQAAISCGAKPEIAAEDGARQIKLDAQIEVDHLRQAPPRANIRAMVAASRRELRRVYSKIEKPLVDHYLLWVTCQTISHDEKLAASQMFDEYSNLYRLMSESIDQAPSPPD